MKKPKQVSKPKKAPTQKQPTTPAPTYAECTLELSYAAPESYFIPTEDDVSTEESLVLFGVFDKSPLLKTEVQIFRKTEEGDEEKFEAEDPDYFRVVEGSIKVQQFNELHMRLFIHHEACAGLKYFTVRQYPKVGVGECIVEKVDVSFELNAFPTS